MKKIVTIVFPLLISIVITLLAINCLLKNILVNSITSSLTSEEISSKIIKTIENNFPEASDSDISLVEDSLYNSPEMTTITTKYMEGLTNDLLNNTVTSIDISSEINNMYNNAISQVNLSEEIKIVIKERINNIDFDNVYMAILYGIKDRKFSNINQTLKCYNFITSAKVKYILIVIIALSYLLYLLITRSILKTINIFATSLLFSSMFIFIIIMVLSRVATPLTYKVVGKPIEFNINQLFVVDLAHFITGLILNKVYDYITDKQ